MPETKERPPARLLVIDDEVDYLNSLCTALKRKGYLVQSSASATEALAKLAGGSFDIIICDISMPDMDGITLLKKIKSEYPEIEVIMLTAHGTPQNIFESGRLKAVDFLTKPPELTNLYAVINKTLDKMHYQRENELLRREWLREVRPQRIIGNGRAMREVLSLVERVGPTDSTALITGESGTGKELVARALHTARKNPNDIFVPVDCGSLDENLLTNELFGHEKGAYTSANEVKRGLFEEADGGTIFLDEIGEISPSIQAKLLRVIETREFRRVGSTRTIMVNVRLIMATNRNLKEMVEKGKFREDLFYRLNVVQIHLAPLRERREDIPLIVEDYITRRGYRHTIEPSAMESMMRYNWPGNVRELRNVLERALIISNSEVITLRDLPFTFSEIAKQSAPSPNELIPLRDYENRYILRVFEETGRDRKKTCEILQIDPKTLYRKLRALLPKDETADLPAEGEE